MSRRLTFSKRTTSERCLIAFRKESYLFKVENLLLWTISQTSCCQLFANWATSFLIKTKKVRLTRSILLTARFFTSSRTQSQEYQTRRVRRRRAKARIIQRLTPVTRVSTRKLSIHSEIFPSCSSKNSTQRSSLLTRSWQDRTWQRWVSSQGTLTLSSEVLAAWEESMTSSCQASSSSSSKSRWSETNQTTQSKWCSVSRTFLRKFCTTLQKQKVSYCLW